MLTDTEFEAQKTRLIQPIQPGEQVRAPEAMDKSIVERQIISLLQEGRKLDAIKLYRMRTGLGLKEAKDKVEDMAAKHGLPVSQNTGCLIFIVIMTMISTIGYTIV